MKSFLDKINIKLNAQEGFLKAVSVLVGGTAFAQFISILSLPILTRIYSPEDFGLFAIYTSLLMTLSVASCLRFEIAIPIANDDEEAISLTFLALISNIIISTIILIIIILYKSEILILLGQPNFSVLIWFIPIGIFLLGVYNSLQFWTTRKKKFKLIANNRMLQSIVGVSLQIIVGLFGGTSLGLVLGQIVKTTFGIKKLFKNFIKDLYFLKYIKNINDIKSVFIKYKKYPKYSSLESLANSAGIQLPIILIATMTFNSEAGYLMLATQIMAIPIGFIGGAVAQVYLANGNEKYNRGELKQYTYQCVNQLIKIGIFPLAIICIAAPTLVPIIFGNEWERAGDMILVMFPWFAMQLLVSPVSMSLNITGLQKISLVLQMFGLFLRCFGLWLISKYEVNYMFSYYAFSGFLFYLIYFVVVVVVVKGK